MWNLKKAKLIETKNSLVVARSRGWGWGVREMGEIPVVRLTSPGDVMCNLVTTVNDTVLYIWKLLRE